MKSESFNFINHQVRDNFIKRVLEIPCDGKTQGSISEVKDIRRSAQNRLYWKWLKELADHINFHKPETDEHIYSDDDMHEYFRQNLLPKNIVEVFGQFVEKRKTTTKLSVKEFSEYLNQIELFALQKECQLSHPEDLYMTSIYGARR